MNKAFLLAVVLITTPCFADMPDANGVSARFGCDADSNNASLFDVAVRGIDLGTGNDKVTFALNNGVVTLGPIVLGVTDPQAPECIADHPFTEYAPVTPTLAYQVCDTRTYTSDCYAMDYNLYGVANWGRKQHVTLKISQAQASPVVFEIDQIVSFPHLELCSASQNTIPACN